jgi:DNA invertase Pin-like site-specific DNA recombinase
MSRPRRIGVSYGRFSDPKQAKGDSENRQERMYRGFCQNHNLTPLTEVFLDRGRSGYRDEHRKKGKLGVLIRYAKDGRFEPGTVIVVEAWDRLGRLRPDKQTALVAELLQTGVDIGVCQLSDIFTESDFGTHKWTILSTFIMLAYQESKQKAERVAASWESRREHARENGTVIAGRLPAWVEMVNGEARLIPERATALKRIFRLAGDGYGFSRIVRTLKDEEVPPFGPSGAWSRGYVRMLLNDRRAVGEHQPFKQTGPPEARAEVPDGPPIPGYFPGAVTEDEYQLARAGQGRRRNGAAPRQQKYVNLFRGLLRHARDGAGFTVVNKATGQAPKLSLMNVTAEGGACYTFPLGVFEGAILSLLREVDPRDVLPRQGQGPGRADVLRAELRNVRQDLAAIKEDLHRKYSRHLAEVLREKETEEERVAGELQEELARQASSLEKDWRELPTLADLAGADEGRLRLAATLRRVIEEVWVLIVVRGSYRFCAAQIFFAGGARRDYLVLNQSTGFNRPGGWWARSFADALGPADYDLRRREDARQLEAALAALDLSDLG